VSRILIVEDDPDIAELVRHYLVRAGHETVIVGSGLDALPRIRDERPDLLVLDLMLPGLHGLEVCRLIRTREETRDLPIIMLTARATESDRVVGFEVGADDGPAISTDDGITIYDDEPAPPKKRSRRSKAEPMLPELVGGAPGDAGGGGGSGALIFPGFVRK
jgi:CheY-like chemotaxis protein